ncbi:MAG: hypothetical protein OXH04_14335 [Acidobacteria bacterium]|nr:hypothetical protein [Acidobacteriota bacterium]
MRQVIYVRTMRIWVEPDAGRFRRIARPPLEREVARIPEPRDITPRASSRRIPVRVRGETWMDRAHRAMDRLGLRASAWLRNVARR